MNVSPHHILIIKASSLGDIIHAMPAVSAIRQRFSGAKITWLVKKPWAPILEGNPDIGAVISVDFALRSWPGLIQQLRKGQFDLALDFQGLFRSGLLAKLSGAPHRVGFAHAREGAPMFYTDLVHLPGLDSIPWRLGHLHAVDRNLALAAYVGADPARSKWHFPDFSEDRHVVHSLLRAAQVGNRDTMVAVAPWSRSPLKCWPLDRFVGLVTSLLQKQGIRPVIIGGQDDRERAIPFRELEGRGMINMVGKVTLRQLPVLLRQMKGFVGNDSALLHMATGLGIPAVGLYGPTSWEATGPYPLTQHVTVRSALPCSPCGKQNCRHTVYQECLRTIETEEVLARLQSLWESPSHGGSMCSVPEASQKVPVGPKGTVPP